MFINLIHNLIFYRFGVDSVVGRSISDTIKVYFSEPYANWSQTPEHIRQTWVKCLLIIFKLHFYLAILNYFYVC